MRLNKNISVIYITASRLREPFATYVRDVLWKAKGGLPLISVSKKPLDYGQNLCFDGPVGVWNEYWETYQGVLASKTKYVAIAEDDTLYSYQHFEQTPVPGSFTFNIACWQIYTWVKPAMYSWKGRRNHNGLICERDLYIKEMEERFAKYPTPESIKNVLPSFGEPSRYESGLGITVYPATDLMIPIPNVRFCHEDDAQGWLSQGSHKRLGNLRAYDVYFWGPAEALVEKYREVLP